MEERFRLRSSIYDPTSRLRLEAKKKLLATDAHRGTQTKSVGRFAVGDWRFEAIRGTREEGRWTKKEREIKKVRRLENRKRNAGWINKIVRTFPCLDTFKKKVTKSKPLSTEEK